MQILLYSSINYLVLCLCITNFSTAPHKDIWMSRKVQWLEELDEVVNHEFPEGIRRKELLLMSDNGSQPTSVTFLIACRDVNIRQAFTTYGNPIGNAETEKVFRTMKEELIWLREWSSPFELSEAVYVWIEYYNRYYLHSALDYRSPINFEQEYKNSQLTFLVTPWLTGL